MTLIRPGDVPPVGQAEGAAFAREEIAGLGYMFWGRLIALGVIAVWLLLTLPLERSGLYVGAIAVFAILGAPPYFLARKGIGGIWVTAAFLLLDVAILCYLLIVPAPYTVPDWTPQLNLRLPNFLYMGVFLVGMALSYSPVLVLWSGIAATGAWSAGYLWVASLPESQTHTSRDMLDRGLSPDLVVTAYLNPHAVSFTTLLNQLVFLGLVTMILTVTVWRSRRLVRRQVAAEAQRGALSRYFSPNIVRELTTGTAALDRPVVQPAAVLFADMVGFTAISERLSPEELVHLLSEFHGHLARVAFAHDGTVDKYIGDAIMVHFGTPRAKEDDPVRALACAIDMVDEMDRWNAARAASGQAPIHLGIGVHYGELVVGNIGNAQRLEYTVLGDTVNVASRLERLTRETGARVVVSDDLVRAVRERGIDPLTLAPGLRRDEARTVRGRHLPVTVWTLA